MTTAHASAPITAVRAASLRRAPRASVLARALAIATAIALVAPAARAQTMSNAALAETLYQEGKRLMAAKKYADACPKFAESQRLDPGTGTLLNLAVCHQSIGMLATAWAEFSDALASARRDGQTDRAKFAEEQIAALEPKLSHLTISVPPAARVPGLEIKLDGAAIGPAAWGVATPIDPGTHEIAATAGARTWSKQIEIHPDGGDDQTVEVQAPGSAEPAPAPALSAGGSEPPTASLPRAQAEAAPAPPRPADTGRTSGRGAAVLGYVAGGVGVAGLAVGSVFGLRAFSQWHTRNDNCVDGACTQAAVDAANQAKTAARIADVSFAVGLVGVGVGAYLLLTSGPREPKTASVPPAHKAMSLELAPEISARGAMMGIGGRW